MLDVLAGVSEEKMIECHGHFRTASCTKCPRSFDGKECKRVIVEEKCAPICPHCGGYVKPDVSSFFVRKECDEFSHLSQLSDVCLVLDCLLWRELA